MTDKLLFDRLMATVRTKSELERLVGLYLDERLASITNGDNLADDIFRLIDWGEAKGRLADIHKMAAAAQQHANKDDFLGRMPTSELAVELEGSEEELVSRHKEWIEARKQAEYRKHDLHGRTLAGRFLVNKFIGAGGVGSVWSAYDTARRKMAAIKTLHYHISSVIMKDRFFRGARVMSNLNHANIVKILEPFGSEDDLSFFAMELIDGPNFESSVRQQLISAEDAMVGIIRVSKALHYAHSLGYVHRDVKPANILIDEATKEFKLTDFDLVKCDDSAGFTLTGGLGTWVYSAPEAKVAGRDADLRADIFSLGMTAVFVILGKEPPPLAAYDPAAFLETLPCSEAVRSVLEKSLELSADLRFSTAEEFAEALEIALSDKEAPGVNVEAKQALNRLPKNALLTLINIESQLEANDFNISESLAHMKAAFWEIGKTLVVINAYVWDAKGELTRSASTEERESDIPIDDTVQRRVRDEGEVLLTSPNTASSLFDGRILYLPIAESFGFSHGLVQIYKVTLQRFKPSEVAVAQRLCKALVNRAVASSSIQLARDRSLAAQTRDVMLASTFPTILGYDIACIQVKAGVYLGEYCEGIPLPSGESLFVIAEALRHYSSSLAELAFLRGFVTSFHRENVDLAAELAEFNNRFTKITDEDRFLVVLFMLIDPKLGKVTIANAGHGPPFLQRPNQRASPVGEEGIGLPLGIVEDMEYDLTEVMMQLGDKLILISDGVNEAMNSAGDMYGYDRLFDRLSHLEGSSQSICEGILSDINKFRAGAELYDDITIVVLQRES
ncbi:Serine/threonine-protein kinase PknA [Bremerella volcania]|uniref:Serine/threonine-protein kinase PknA n=1 Tax=Bremerella volcania TaxID=2527984 RepID=A0A518C827_9BACT|nr:SpoIIE family protein phosphatase [Bremerella volcania]QDU75381.1 Serine/threonine-protein kinase PknA [Bremerella volcania]